MKRTDFTQNFPGGIIKGDSRCREGEEMEEKIDLNVCYRRAFEALGITGSVQKFTDYITEYAPVVLIVLDIGGKILAMSHKGEYNETLLPEGMDSKRIDFTDDRISLERVRGQIHAHSCIGRILCCE